MGNKQSAVDEQMQDQPCDSTQSNKMSKQERQQQFDEVKKLPKKRAVNLDNVNPEDLKKAGMRTDIAEKLAEASTEGKLKDVKDIVTVLETNSVPLQVTFDKGFNIEKDASGALFLHCKEQEPIKKKKKSFSFRRSFIGKKRKEKSSSDPDWSPEDEDHDDGEESEVKGAKRRFKLKQSSRGRHSSKSEDDNTDDNEELADDMEKIDLNAATEEDLDALVGIGPGLARKIVQYKEQHGRFHDLEDLVAIKGISKRSLKKLSPQLYIKDEEDCCEKPCTDIKLSPVANDNSLRYGKRDVVRMITWNLQCFSNEKAENPGVIEVICRTILENGVSIAVLQEIGDEEAIFKIKDELNKPTIKGLKKLKNNKSNWECVTSDVAGNMFRSREYNGFLFDTSRGIQVTSHDLIEKPVKGKKQFSRRPFLGYFKASGFDFVVVSVHLKATGLGNEDIGKLQKELAHIPDVITAIKDKIPGEKDTIIVGDFNLEPDEKDFDSFKRAGMSNLIPSTMFTNISSSNMDGSKCYDNIWISKHTKDHYFTERAGVIRKGMNHSMIPDGWKMNGVASDHCPVWAEFYCDRDMDKTAGIANVEDITIQSKP